MSGTRGVAIVAYGPQAWAQADACLESVRAWDPSIGVTVATDRLKPYSGRNVRTVHPDSEPYGRRAKLTLPQWTEYPNTLYLDADTRVAGDLSAPFALLDYGWDMAITLSLRQSSDVLGHVSDAERAATITEATLGPQAGVFYVAKTLRTAKLFGAWLQEWQRFGPHDQAALVRAYMSNPVRLWLLGRAYNAGELVEHHFGAAARRVQ